MNHPGAVRDLSWPMLLAIAAVIVGAQLLVSQFVYFNEGEVFYGAYFVFIGATVCALFIGFHRRTTAAWCLIGFGGLILLWQLYATRKLIMLHEEVVRIVNYANAVKRAKGEYPVDLGGYQFYRPWLRSHVQWTRTTPGDFRLDYFMHSLGTAFWYDTQQGIGYYPD